jgi:quinohemoprotein ethanol dehydrogenase
MSFNPKTKNLYVCGVSQAQVFGGGKTAVYHAGKQFNGSTFAPQGTPTGTFTAINATTNRIAWQRRFPDSCYSGSTTTAGNLVFVGRNDGRLQAYNATNGKLLWSFHTGAGANNTASVFSLGGKEVVAFASRTTCTSTAKQTPDIEPGSTVALKVKFAKPGSYPYLCTLPGHAEAGMKGVLKVT